MLGPRTMRLKLLIVEPDAAPRRRLADSFRLWGARVLEAAGTAEAVSLLRHDAVEFLVLAWTPDGAALLRWLREDAASPDRALPAIALTRAADLSTVRVAWTAGAQAVMAAPVTPLALLRRIESVLAAPRDGASAVALPGGRHTAPAWIAVAALEEEDRAALRRRIDRLEPVLAMPGSPVAPALLADLYRHATDRPLLQEVAALLGVCLTAVRPGAPGQADAALAHLAALRWAVDGEARAELAARRLLASLRGTVRHLVRRHPATATPLLEAPHLSAAGRARA